MFEFFMHRGRRQFFLNCFVLGSALQLYKYNLKLVNNLCCSKGVVQNLVMILFLWASNSRKALAALESDCLCIYLCIVCAFVCAHKRVFNIH